MSSLVRSEPLYDQIYEILWEKILAGEIPPETRLRDVEWAKQLNVSRTPVREALRKLQKDGVLEPVGSGRYILKRIGPNDLRDLYKCRAVLEALALRDLRVAPRDLKRLDAVVKKTKDCLTKQDFDAAFRLNTEFHQILILSSTNSYLLMLLDNIRKLTLYARSSLRSLIDESASLAALYGDHLKRTQKSHMLILDSLKKEDYEAAAKHMEAHVFETGNDMGEIFDLVMAKPVPAAKRREGIRSRAGAST